MSRVRPDISPGIGLPDDEDDEDGEPADFGKSAGDRETMAAAVPTPISGDQQQLLSAGPSVRTYIDIICPSIMLYY